IEPRALGSSDSGIGLGACQRAGSLVLGRTNAGRTRVCGRPAASGGRRHTAGCGRGCGVMMAAVALVGARDARLWRDLACPSLPVEGADSTVLLARVAPDRSCAADSRGSAAPGGR